MTDGLQLKGLRIVVGTGALVAVVYATGEFWQVLTNAPPSTFDDSYMFIRYAKHILAGDGLAWNPGGEQTYGITSLLYVLIVTLLRWATSFSDADVVRLGSGSLGAVSVVVMALTAGRFSLAPFLRRNYLLWAGLLFPLVLISGPYIYHSLTGMDTMLAVCMHSILIFVTMRLAEKESVRAIWPVVLVGYLAFLARPDSALYAAFFPAAAIYLLTDAKRRFRLLLTFWISLGLVLAIDAGIKYLVFGVPVPLPAYAKMHAYYKEYAGLWMWNPVQYLLGFCSLVLPFLAVMIAFTKRHSAPLLLVFLLPAILTLSTYLNIVQIMGYRMRFNIPSLPFFAMAAVFILDRYVQRWHDAPKPSIPGVVTRAILIGGLVTLLPMANDKLTPLYKMKLIAKAPKAEPVYNVAGLPILDYWTSVDAIIQLGRKAPAGSLFCMSEYGKIGAMVPDLSIYDPLGLHDLKTAREGFSAEVLFEHDPDVIWMPHPDYIAMRREIMAEDEFWSDYDYYPAAYQFGIAVRKSGARAEVLRKVFAETWKQYYPKADMAKNQLTR